MTEEQKHWKLFYDTTRALFVLNDILVNQAIPNWYYQELFYIKLVCFMDEAVNYIEGIKAKFKDDEIRSEWLECVREGINTIIDNLSEDELVYIHYRRTRAAHMFQSRYEENPNDQGNAVVRILQKDGTLKSYMNSDVVSSIERIESNYSRSDILDRDFDRKIHPLLNNLRHNLNKIYNKMGIASKAEE